MSIPVFKSAHLDKAKPIDLSQFAKEKFDGNITAYKVDFDPNRKGQEFPYQSAKPLGISERGLKAVKAVFPFLDNIFRANGAGFIPQNHSRVSDHIVGLKNLSDDIFNTEARESLANDVQKKVFDKIAERVRLSLLLHDLPELLGEISTFCQRLPENESLVNPGITESSKKNLEFLIFKTVMFNALKASYKDEIDEQVKSAILESQKQMREAKESPIERFRIGREFIGMIPNIYNGDYNPQFTQDYTKLLDAYALSDPDLGNPDDIIAALTLMIDKLESKIHCGVVGNYGDLYNLNPVDKIFSGEFKRFKDLDAMSQNHPVLKPIIDNVRGFMKNILSVYREWPKLNQPLAKFEDL